MITHCVSGDKTQTRDGGHKMEDPRLNPDYDPNAAYIAFHCDDCGGPLYEGDDYYKINGYRLCESCALEWLNNQKAEAERGINP